MLDVADVLWRRVNPVLAAFAEKLCGADPNVIGSVGHTKNDAFLLRGYLTFTKHPSSEEVAVTVDLRSGSHWMKIESDACTDDGNVVAAGPTAAFQAHETSSDIETAIDNWLREFEWFLEANTPAIARAAAQLA